MKKFNKTITWFDIIEEHGIERSCEPVTLGIPLTKGLVFEPSNLALTIDGQELPVEFIVLSSWGDGSIKWLQVLFVCKIRSFGSNRYYVQNKHEKTLCTKVVEAESPAFSLSYTNGGQLILGFPNGIKVPADVICRDVEGNKVAVRFESSQILRNGLMVEIEVDGQVMFNKRPCRIRVLAKWISGSTAVHLEATLHNPWPAIHKGGLWDLGDECSVYLSELSLKITCPEGKPVLVPDVFESPQRQYATDGVCLYQDSSGGENWESNNHVTASGRLSVRFQGYRLEQAGQPTQYGRRANPFAVLSGNDQSLVVALHGFWQNFSKKLSVNQGEINLSLFPEETAEPHELQGGERKRHYLVLGFSVPEKENQIAIQAMAPLTAILDPQHVRNSRAVRRLVETSWKGNSIFAELIDSCIEGPECIEARREIIDEFGWRNFGDCYADHEVREGEGNTPYITHYNNQYDLVYSFLRYYLKRGDARWWRLGQDLARHVMDIDIYRTEDDRSDYNYGLFWHTNHFKAAETATHRCFSARQGGGSGYGGGPSNQHCYAAGLVLYYCLTGDRDAYRTVIGLAQKVISGVAGPTCLTEVLEKFGRELFIRSRPKKSHQKKISSYSSNNPGRSLGNALRVLMDAYELTHEPVYLHSAEKLIHRCCHPHDDIAGLELLNAEFRWSYTIFLQALAWYLSVKEEHGAQDECWHYAKEVLLNYSRWMAEKEYPFLDKPELLECPNYATRSAQDLRKAAVLYEASGYCCEDESKYFREKAEYFVSRTETDLVKYDTASSMRPLAVILQNLDTITWHRLLKSSDAGSSSVNQSFVPPYKDNFLKWLVQNGYFFIKALFRLRPAHELRFMVRRYKELRG